MIFSSRKCVSLATRGWGQDSSKNGVNSKTFVVGLSENGYDGVRPTPYVFHSESFCSRVGIPKCVSHTSVRILHSHFYSLVDWQMAIGTFFPILLTSTCQKATNLFMLPFTFDLGAPGRTLAWLGRGGRKLAASGQASQTVNPQLRNVHWQHGEREHLAAILRTKTVPRQFSLCCTDRWRGARRSRENLPWLGQHFMLYLWRFWRSSWLAEAIEWRPLFIVKKM